MAQEFVTVAHPDIEGTAEIPLSTLPIREARGWSRVGVKRSKSPSAPVDENPDDQAVDENPES